MLKRLLKTFLYMLAGFIVLLILIGGLTQTRRFKNWLRDQIVTQAAASLNGTLHLGRIEGNLVSNFGFRDLRIELDRDTLLYVSNIEVGLSPYELLKRQVLVGRLIFQAPVLTLRQRPDSAWNVAHLLKPSAATAEPEPPSPWRIALQNLQVENGAIIFAPLDTIAYKLLPRRVQKISTAMRLEYADDHLDAVLRNLQFKAVEPNLKLNSLAARVFLAPDSLMVKDFKLHSGESHLAGQIMLRHFTQPIFDVDLQAAPLQSDDLHAFLPGLKIAGPVQGAIHVIGDVQNVRATFELAHADGLAMGSFFVLQDSTATVYNVEAMVRALNLNPYIDGATRLNFDLKLDGSGITLDDLNANLAATIDSSQALGRELEHVRLTAQARERKIQFKLLGRSAFGELDLSGWLDDPLGRQFFKLDAEGRHFDAAKLLQNDTLASDVSFRLTGAGQHFNAEQLKFDGWLRLSPSRLPAVLIDSAYCQLHARGSDFQIDTLRLVSSMGNVQAAGLLSLRYENNFRFNAELGDLTWVKRAMEADTLRATGTISGNARGPLDSLAVAGRFDLRQVQYNTTSIKRLLGNLTFNRLHDRGRGLIQMQGHEMVAGYLPVDSAKALVLYDLKQAQINANFWQGLKNYGELDGLYTFGEIGRFEVQRAELNVLGQTWRTPADSAMWIDVGDEDYDFHHCALIADNQRLYLDGRLSYTGNEDLNFRIEGVDIATLAAMMGSETSLAKNTVAGVLALQGRLTGDAEAPILAGRINWNRGRVADFVFDNWESDFGYRNGQFSCTFTLHQNQNRRLTGEGYLPMNLGLNNPGKVLYDDRPIRIQAATSGIETGIDLAFLQTLTSRARQVKGTLVFDVKLENTLKAPRATGVMRVLDGAFNVPEYGVSYNDVQLTASIDSTHVKVNDFRVQSERGGLNAKGQFKYDRGTIGEASGSLAATDFLALRTRDMEVRLDANINASGNTQGARYRGDITVDRSRFFLPALQQNSVLQLEENAAVTSAPADSTKVVTAKPEANGLMQQWLQNLRGELKVKIPRNTWIRGPELNAEIEGTLDFTQEGSNQFFLFGTLNIIRGNYELFGKRFEISSGQITFQGDPYAPQFELEAKHVFRAPGDREKKSLEVSISGSLANPQIQFKQNGEQLDEHDALANLIFGLNFNQLSFIQRKKTETELENEYTAAAKGLISGLVSQQLEKSLGRGLNLDVIEFQGAGGDFSQTSVLVGKYITNDLFISFEQEPEGRVFSLELELLKSLFLQAAHGGEENRKTGFDFIWKLDW
ncbi:translocation/assembly module TamB domain-containing protein [candidate division KSB1 bacterium]|nr:translocation/assembly module TamB domain-containing protein [candidate division KSB1 bacterium]